MTNYSRIFSNRTNLLWDSLKYEIHHIDKNRDNNDIHNLILIPKELHREYHHCAISVNKIISYKEFDEKCLSPLQATDTDYNSILYFLSLKQEMVCYKQIIDFILIGVILITESTNFDDLVKQYYPDLYKKYL